MRFEKQVFTTDVTLDFNEFIDCEIRNCTVHFHGGDFSLQRTKLTNVSYRLAGPAHSTVQFLKLVRATGSHIFDELMNQGDQPTPAEEPRLS